jgi:hypothetical protein
LLLLKFVHHRQFFFDWFNYQVKWAVWIVHWKNWDWRMQENVLHYSARLMSWRLHWLRNQKKWRDWSWQFSMVLGAWTTGTVTGRVRCGGGGLVHLEEASDSVETEWLESLRKEQ